jgi:hypothetical protein
MRNRNVWITAAVVAVLAIALIVGFQLRDRDKTAANPGASPTPSASGATAVNPGPSASAGSSASPSAISAVSSSIYNDAFGFIVTGGDGPPHISIRRESSDARLANPSATAAWAVSPDGKQIALWSLVVGPAELHLYDVGTGAERTVMTLAAGQRGSGVAWSSDGAGLLYSTEMGGFGVGGDGTNSATLNVYEFATNGRHGTTIDTQTNTGWLYWPIAWDRSANLAAAGLTGEGGGMAYYVTVRIDPNNSFNVQRVDTRHTQDLNGMSMGSIRASSDAKLVLGVEGESGNLKWWPLSDIAATKVQAGVGKRGALWRPGTHEIGFLSAEQFWLGDVDKAGAQGVCCTAFSGAPATSALRTFRADGTAVVLGVGETTAFGQASYTLVRFTGDPFAAKATSGERVTFQDLGGLTTSVRFR